MRPSVFVLLIFAACSPRAVTPPTRTIVMDSPLGPELGKTDAQVDLGKIGQLWGPDLTSGNGRVRHAVAPNVVLEGEAGMLQVTNPGNGPNRNAYTGRAGAIFQSSDQRFALTAGAGGGTSVAAGTWAGVDIGAMVTGHHKYIRPVVSADFGYSAPIGGRKEFTVQDSDQTVTLRLPRNYVGKVNLGLELGRPELAILVGFTMVKFWLLEGSRVNDDDPEDDRKEEFGAFAIGLRARL